jgi:hypothetical protein
MVTHLLSKATDPDHTISILAKEQRFSSSKVMKLSPSLSALALLTASFSTPGAALTFHGAVSESRELNEEPKFHFLVSHIRQDKSWCITAIDGNEEFGNLKLRICDFEGAPANQLFYPDFKSDGSIKIGSAFDNKCIAINHGEHLYDGARARLADCDKTALNDFAYDGSDDFIKVVAGGGEYCLTNVGPNPHPNDFIHAKPCQERPVFKWTAIPANAPPAYFHLVTGGGCAVPRNGNKIFLESCENHADRRWRAKPIGSNGAVLLVNELDGSQCLRAGNRDTVGSGTFMRIQPCDITDELQQFVYDGSRFQLTSRPDLCMVHRGTTANVGVDPIIMKTCNGNQEGWVAPYPLSNPITCTELIVNGNFENDFDNWVTEDQSYCTDCDCALVINDGTFYPPYSPGGPIAPIEGAKDAMTYQIGPSHCTLKQSVCLPPNILTATLSWQDRIRSHISLDDPAQEARVLACLDDGNGPTEIWSTNPGDDAIQLGPNLRSFDVTSLVLGKSAVDVRFDQEIQNYHFEMNWDTVSLKVCSSANTFSPSAAPSQAPSQAPTDICDIPLCTCESWAANECGSSVGPFCNILEGNGSCVCFSPAGDGVGSVCAEISSDWSIKWLNNVCSHDDECASDERCGHNPCGDRNHCMRLCDGMRALEVRRAETRIDGNCEGVPCDY